MNININVKLCCYVFSAILFILSNFYVIAKDIEHAQFCILQAIYLLIISTLVKGD